ncbi:unnamed protein product [Pseudo-nitzschia multistriata]|uniref:Uncharacterized protein n=1 Tax=Pseudo-nitzschia multistriata TaxID=183589 RepID=A0A448Z9W2_9STRA|nr:unnamed protein product [Pseudo-nitzschia multistriata]
MEAQKKKEPRSEMPYSFEERLLVRSSPSDGQGTPASPLPATQTHSVRLESLAQWEEGSWIHPFSDIDMNLSASPAPTTSDLHAHYGGKIARVHMSVSSHGTRELFPDTPNSLDGVPVLPLWKDDASTDTNNNTDSSDRYCSGPQGFYLSVRTFDGLEPEEEANAVQAVFEELIRRRILVNPVTDGVWDVLDTAEQPARPASVGASAVPSLSPRLYQLVMPFDAAAWSSDALAQSFRRTLPGVCKGKAGGGGDDDRFFGWSAQEWSDFLVGYRGGGGALGTGKTPSQQHPTFNKIMWWTWTASTKNGSENSDGATNLGLSFGIQYQTMVPAEDTDWLPDAFASEETPRCPIGTRASFEVLPTEEKAHTGGYRLVPMTASSDSHSEGTSEETPQFAYQVNVDQVLRRHHTNRGRFESSIETKPLDDAVSSGGNHCRLTYRQVLPDFLAPMWRTLKVVSGESTGANQYNGNQHTDSDRLHASVEWNHEDQSSVLYVEAASGTLSDPSALPPNIFVSLEYAPSFLTIDDFPGDPNRGRVLPPARVAVRCDPFVAGSAPVTPTVVYSNALLLLPPVPDLSMPFNVVSVGSSVYAYCIGAIVTLLVRKAPDKIKYKMYPDKKPESKLIRIKNKLREKIGRAKSKLLGGASSTGSEAAKDESAK